MPNIIERVSHISTFVATNSTTTSPKISLCSMAGGMVVVESTTGASDTITWYVAKNHDATQLHQLYNSNGSAVTTAVAANRAYPLPDEVFGARFLVAVMGAGDASLTLHMKG